MYDEEGNEVNDICYFCHKRTTELVKCASCEYPMCSECLKNAETTIDGEIHCEVCFVFAISPESWSD